MKHLYLLLAYTAITAACLAQSNEWTWIKGDNSTNLNGIYGTKGAAADANQPGSRNASTSWTDASGNFWVFGGTGYPASGTTASNLNDLWKFTPANSRWTWIHGDSIVNQFSVYGTRNVSNINNKPGARYNSVSWTDASGNLWLFGGLGYGSSSAGYLNDLWRFNTTTGEWTWIAGNSSVNQMGVYGNKGVAASTNKPGARYRAVSWTDASGNLWLFGGSGYAATTGPGNLNDLWKFNTATSQWTWISGDSTLEKTGVYGTKGTPNVANAPGGRFGATGKADALGNLWLFGGRGLGISATPNRLNDLWKFNTTTNQWTWVGGDNNTNDYGNYGTKGVPVAANKPGARDYATMWIDNDQVLWLIGGFGVGSSGSSGYLNDLWRYSQFTNTWTWIAGNNTIDNTGIYGTQGTSSPTNTPGGRLSAVTFVDATGNLVITGGQGFSATGAAGNLNDMWSFTPAATLPVTLVNFTAQAQNNSVVLNWSTASESNSQSFQVERSADGLTFETVGTIAASGNSASLQHYRFTDEAALPATSYYRLKMIDLDQQSKYSSVQKVFREATVIAYTIKNNPVTSTLALNIQLEKTGQVGFYVTDVAGHQLVSGSKTFTKGIFTYNLPVAQLSAGTYYVTVVAGQQTSTRAFFKQ